MLVCVCRCGKANTYFIMIKYMSRKQKYIKIFNTIVKFLSLILFKCMRWSKKAYLSFIPVKLFCLCLYILKEVMSLIELIVHFYKGDFYNFFHNLYIHDTYACIIHVCIHVCVFSYLYACSLVQKFACVSIPLWERVKRL